MLPSRVVLLASERLATLIGACLIAASFGPVPACGGSDSSELDEGEGSTEPDASTGSGGSSGADSGSPPPDAAPLSCDNSLDCVGAAGRTVCDPNTGMCVECIGSADCDGTADCVGNVCVSYVACDNSRDCPLGMVCDTGANRCVECVGDADCGSGGTCVANLCRTACASDNQCTPQGLLCNTLAGYCVECVLETDCDAAEHCSEGACREDACEESTSTCQNNTVVRCTSSGSGYEAPAPCGARQTCVENGSAASCASWVCTAGAVECMTTLLVTCADDGLSIVSQLDCAAEGQFCAGGSCGDQLCAPNQRYCDANTVMQCSADGLGATVVQACGATEYCDGTTAACRAQACSPGAPACNGTVATTCNPQGSGYELGGANCALGGQACANGVCTTCPGGAGAVNDVALEEVNLGTLDYVVLRNNNASGCSANLDGLSLAFVAGKPADFTFDLPSYTLAAGATVFVVEGTPQPQDISTATNIDIGPLDGAYIALCNGVCNASDGSNVIDIVATAGVSGLPPPITFSSPLTGVTDTNENTTSYVRVAHDSALPNFRGADWAIGQASRTPACDPAACTGCNAALLQMPCCTPSDTCGCRILGAVTCTPI